MSMMVSRVFFHRIVSLSTRKGAMGKPSWGASKLWIKSVQERTYCGGAGAFAVTACPVISRGAGSLIKS
jgi:hypothetical protein